MSAPGLPAGPEHRIRLEELVEYLEAHNLMIVGLRWPFPDQAPVVELAPRVLLACGHPASCLREGSLRRPFCRACQLEGRAPETGAGAGKRPGGHASGRPGPAHNRPQAAELASRRPSSDQ